MSRYNAAKLLLTAVFLIVLVAGAVCTINNARRWSVSMGAVTRKYENKAGNTALSSMAESDEGAAEDMYLTQEDLAYGEDGTGAGAALAFGNDAAGQGNAGVQGAQGSGEGADIAGGSVSEEDGAADTDSTVSVDGGNSDGTGDAVLTENDTTGTQDKDFFISGITDEIYERIKGRSYPEGCPLSLNELKYVHVLHVGFDGRMHVGELIVNASIADEVLDIFKELYEIKYPIEKLRLIDEYAADDEKSMEDNNSSAFCYRTVAESTALSRHAYGLAIDINPFYNPYHFTRTDGSTFLQPAGSEKYMDRSLDEPYMIKQGDACYRIFTAHGFTWGGEWNTKKDYQHFEHK